MKKAAAIFSLFFISLPSIANEYFCSNIEQAAIATMTFRLNGNSKEEIISMAKQRGNSQLILIPLIEQAYMYPISSKTNKEHVIGIFSNSTYIICKFYEELYVSNSK